MLRKNMKTILEQTNVLKIFIKITKNGYQSKSDPKNV